MSQYLCKLIIEYIYQEGEDSKIFCVEFQMIMQIWHSQGGKA